MLSNVFQASKLNFLFCRSECASCAFEPKGPPKKQATEEFISEIRISSDTKADLHDSDDHLQPWRITFDFR